jgi:hypothetical protein
MAKWNAEITRHQLLNKLVKPNDTVKTKNQIAQSLIEMAKNYDTNRLSDGFNSIGPTLGQEKADILTREKQLQDTLVRTRREKTPTYTERKKVIDMENQKKMKETQNLIEKVAKTRNDIKQKNKFKIAEQRKLEELMAQKLEESNEKEKEERELLKQKKLEEIDERRKKQEETRLKQNLDMKDYNKKYNSKKPRYVEIQEEYQEKTTFTHLEKKKRMLASLRDLHQPLNMERIEEEQKKYEEIIRENNAKKRQELIEKLKENEESYDYRKYKSKYMEKVIENELLSKEQKLYEGEKKREHLEKWREYDEIVKQKYKPVTSRRKQEELIKIKEKLTMSPQQKARRSSPIIQSDKEDMHALAQKRKRIFEWKNPLLPPTPEPKKQIETIDYLKKFKSDRQSEFERTGRQPHEARTRSIDYDNLQGSEKFDVVKIKADMMESEAKNIQKYLNIKGGGSMAEKEQVNDMLFESMNAKLSLLQSSVKNQ